MTALLPPPTGDTFADALLGDGEALDDLLRQHRPSVEAVCFRRLRSRIDAEDAIQETMLRGIRSLHHVEDPSRLRGYLCRIAERVCLDMLRDGAKAMPVQVETALAPPANEREQPEQVALEQERARLVHETLEALNDRHARALWMRDALGESVPKVAETFGMTEGSTRVMLTRARAKMREGWAKVAALIPGLGWKLPSISAKALTLGPIAVPVTLPLLAVAMLVAATPVAVNAIAGDPTSLVRDVNADVADKSSATSTPVPLVTTAIVTPPSDAGGRHTSPTPTPASPSSSRPAPAASLDLGATTVTAGTEPSTPEDDNVTVGDDDLLQVGTDIEQLANELGAGGAQQLDIDLASPSS